MIGVWAPAPQKLHPRHRWRSALAAALGYVTFRMGLCWGMVYCKVVVTGKHGNAVIYPKAPCAFIVDT